MAEPDDRDHDLEPDLEPDLRHDPEHDLEHRHDPEAIRERLGESHRPQYLSDAVLGGIDGAITTVAIVAGAVGAGFASLVALVLGFANLLADGLSMAVSNFEAVQSRKDHVEDLRRQEERHIRKVPEGEREEIRQIFQRKGFEGDVLERIVETITSDRDLWIETMLTEEHGVEKVRVNPMRSAGATFGAFVGVGALPLLPLLLPLELDQQFVISAIVAAGLFFAIGVVKGKAYNRPAFRAGIQTLLNGSAATTLAFAAGYGLNRVFGGG